MIFFCHEEQNSLKKDGENKTDDTEMRFKAVIA
jgi:hypothetical protein